MSIAVVIRLPVVVYTPFHNLHLNFDIFPGHYRPVIEVLLLGTLIY